MKTSPDGLQHSMAAVTAATPAAASTANPNATTVNLSQSDIRSIARANLVKLRQQLTVAAPKHSNDITRFHIDDSIDRINTILKPQQD